MTSSPQHIRKARRADLAAIRRIEEHAFEPSRRSAPASLRRALASGFQQVLVLEAGGVLVGYVIVWPYRYTWRIYNLAADPEYRRQGAGSALMVAVIEAADRAGARRVVLESRNEPGLLGFYQRHGFRAGRLMANYYSKGEDAVRMERSLAGNA